MILRAQLWWIVRGDERGANLVEYALLVAFIALVVVSAIEYLGAATVGHIDDLNTEWETFGSGGGGGG